MGIFRGQNERQERRAHYLSLATASYLSQSDTHLRAMRSGESERVVCVTAAAQSVSRHFCLAAEEQRRTRLGLPHTVPHSGAEACL